MSVYIDKSLQAPRFINAVHEPWEAQAESKDALSVYKLKELWLSSDDECESCELVV